MTKDGFPAAFEQSARLLAEGARPVFEAGFKSEQTIAFADVMIPVVEGECRSWKMVEVKSSTGVKDCHRDDVAVQSFLALCLKRELELRLEEKGLDAEWAEVIRGLDNLQQVELLLQGSRFLLRGEIKGHASQAIRAAEVAMPPVLQELS